MGGGDEIFHPVYILHIAQRGHMPHIVRVIVICKKAASTVKAFDEHTLPVHVREAQRTVDGAAAQFPGPVFHSFKQGGRYLRIVNKVHLREAQTVGAPLLVGLAAQNGTDTAHNLLPAQGQPATGLAVGKGRVLFFVPVLQIIAIGGGNELRHIFI